MGSLSIESVDDGLTYVGGPPIQLRAHLAMAGAATVDVTSVVAWSADVPVVTVTTGVVTATAPGTAVISAELDGQVATFDVRVAEARVLYVTHGGTIATYPPDVDGRAQPIRKLITTHIPRAFWIEGNEIFIADDDIIYVYPATANGEAAPTRRIFTKVSGSPFSARAMQIVNGELFATNVNLAVFPPTADLATEATRHAGNTASPATPWGTFDIIGNEIVLAQAHSTIDIVPITASGPTTPTRSIRGPATGLTELDGIYGVAASDSEIFVSLAKIGELWVYPLSGNGDIAPTRKITNFPTGGRQIGRPWVVGKELYVPVFDPVEEGEIWLVDRDASGAAVPLRKTRIFFSGFIAR